MHVQIFPRIFLDFHRKTYASHLRNYSRLSRDSSNMTKFITSVGRNLRSTILCHHPSRRCGKKSQEHRSLPPHPHNISLKPRHQVHLALHHQWGRCNAARASRTSSVHSPYSLHPLETTAFPSYSGYTCSHSQ